MERGEENSCNNELPQKGGAEGVTALRRTEEKKTVPESASTASSPKTAARTVRK